MKYIILTEVILFILFVLFVGFVNTQLLKNKCYNCKHFITKKYLCSYCCDGYNAANFIYINLSDSFFYLNSTFLEKQFYIKSNINLSELEFML